MKSFGHRSRNFLTALCYPHTTATAAPLVVPLLWAMRYTASSIATEATPEGDAAVLPSPHRSLYKSSHRGSGDVPMPKGFPKKPLKPQMAAELSILGARSSCAEDAGPVPNRPLSPLQKRQLLFKNKAAFVLTPQALRRVKYLLSQHSASREQHGAQASEDNGETTNVAVPTGIRIGVRRRGCSGFSYTVNYYYPHPPEGAAATATKSSPPCGVEDVVVEQDGVSVVVDGDALFYVIGTEMDYVVRNVEEKFTFKNPNQKYGCGCEESFMPFDEDDMND